jgi:hypothetical protein
VVFFLCVAQHTEFLALTILLRRKLISITNLLKPQQSIVNQQHSRNFTEEAVVFAQERYRGDILYMLVNSSTFASQAKISIFASQMTRISHNKCTRFD